MSKNIVIQEGGIGKQLTVDKLKTNLVGGGSCFWVPKDDTKLGNKYISENGTYRAQSDGYYGYSEVTVNGVGSVTGRDGDGDDATATVDDGGSIVITKLPSSIVIEVPPSKSAYNDGETIDFSGMIVKAYTASGALWKDESHPYGVIPINELTLPVTVASASEVSGEVTTATSELIDGVVPMGSWTTRYLYVNWGIIEVTHTISGGAIAQKTNINTHNFETIVASNLSSDTITETNSYEIKEIYEEYKGKDIHFEPYTETVTGGMPHAYTYNNKTAYYFAGVGNHSNVQDPPPVSDIPFDGRVAWTILYGTVTTTGGTQKIPVNWNRPNDNMELSTSFEITVTDGLGGATGGGGQAGDTGAGRND